MKAKPIVAIVVHELPDSTDTHAHTTHATNGKMLGLISSRPYTISVGTTPLAIHDTDTVPMSARIGTAGSIWLEQSLRPRRYSTPGRR